MKRVDSPEALLECSRRWRHQGHKIALVPTMGNLHQGHMELVREAQARADRVIVSIFVNPLQFSQNEDFGSYPDTPSQDQTILESAGVDTLFRPDVKDIYPHGTIRQEAQTTIHVLGLESILCGQSRPGHFSGVATIVAKLFHMADPDISVFGEKDFQQLQVIHRMVADLDFPVEVISVPTVREPDGLAMSSRNQYLNNEQREQAPELYGLLKYTKQQIMDGHKDYRQLEGSAIGKLEGAGFRPDYFRILNASDLSSPSADQKELVILVAAHLGSARLIDNLSFTRPQED